MSDYEALKKNLPAEMRERGLFCLWKMEIVCGRLTKPPYNPRRYGEHARSNDPETFSSFSKCVSVAELVGGFSGVGVGVFDPICGLDIDSCMDASGRLSPMAADIVEIMDTYTEKSPSGRGIHIYFSAPGFQYDAEKFYTINRKLGLEAYVSGQTNKFLTVTGKKIHGDGLHDRTKQLQEVLEKYMKREESPAEQSPPPVAATPSTIDDDEVIRMAMAANDDKFRALWAGDWRSLYDSQSEADMALCSKLAFWTRKDAEQTERLFRASGLMRAKWDTKRRGGTYGTETVRKAIEKTVDVYTPPADPAAVEAFAPPAQSEGVADYIRGHFAADLKRRKEAFSTGFNGLDDKTGGGFPVGITVIGAVSSLGKTTLCGQIADNMAASGKHVIYFSLEQSRVEIISKGVARQFSMKDKASAFSIMRGRVDHQEAARKYAERVGNRLTVLEWEGGGVSAMRDYVRAYRDRTGASPAVFIDYLQILPTEGKANSTKEAVDANMTALRQMAREFHAPIILICSLNRSGYLLPVSFDSFKESGSIEYGADLVLGLHLSCLSNPIFEHPQKKKQQNEIVNAAKAAMPREVDAVILKNRNGSVSLFQRFQYYADRDKFVEGEKDDPIASWANSYG